jgi:hypothetical protein
VYSQGRKKVGGFKTAVERQAVLSARDYLSRLWQERRLPGISGFSTNDQGVAIISGRMSAYPYTLTMRVNKNGEALTNNYTIMEMEKDSPWQLKRAWQTGPNGQIVQEWSVK